MNNNKIKGLTVFALVMLITSAIDSIRNLPATALFGSTLIFFFIFSAIVFLIPTALVSSELAATFTKKQEGGIFGWVTMAFGDRVGFLAIWLQWINTMVWYPTILSFIAGTAAFLIDPALAQNKIYLVSVILGVFWILTLLNFKGIKTSSRFVTITTILGMVIPMILIITLAAIWLICGKPIQIHPNMHTILPNLHHSENWISLTAIMAAFLGMELATVHVTQVNNPQKSFPKGLFYSVILILVTMICGSLSIAFVLPHNKINLVDGVMQAFSNFLHAYHIGWLTPVITVMLLIGSFGGMINWIISPAKGLSQAAEKGFLPKFLQKENKHGVAINLLLTQAFLVTFVCLAFLLMPSINGSYWLLTDLSTQLYMLMYVLMFAAALYLRYKLPHKERPYKIPGGKIGLWCTVMLGLIGTAITLIVGFFPPSGINVGGTLHYEIVFSSGIILMIIPVIFFYGYHFLTRTKSHRQSAAISQQDPALE